MHELGIVFHIIKTVEEVVAEQELAEVRSVTLEIGEVSGVIPSYLDDVWKWAVQNRSEHMKEAALCVETIPAVTYCESCGRTYETVAHGKICPHCKSGHTYLLRGNECTIKEIEAYSDTAK
jgi:hydrogenase nickel incorporation protein HypA/HybF